MMRAMSEAGKETGTLMSRARCPGCGEPWLRPTPRKLKRNTEKPRSAKE